MKLLIVGANGQVGRELLVHAEQQNYHVIAADRHALDISDAEAVSMMFAQHQPDLCINAAAYTAVDLAEKDSDVAYAVNAEACTYLAQACKKTAIPLLHISTDYVFDGKKQEAYIEDDPIAPLGVYGASKAKGEENIRNIWERHIILRTAWVFGAHGNNFVRTMLRLAHEHAELSVVADQYGCPTAASDIAKALLHIAAQLHTNPAWGTYHYCGSPVTTWHAFAQYIFQQAQQHTSLNIQQLHAIKTEAYPTPAQRPLHANMNCQKVSKTFALAQPSWHDSLPPLIKEMCT